jgi:hypothetical protein
MGHMDEAEHHAQAIIPIHYEGWRHFGEGRSAVEGAFAAANLPVELRWLPFGQPAAIEL